VDLRIGTLPITAFTVQVDYFPSAQPSLDQFQSLVFDRAGVVADVDMYSMGCD
jgi:hypothetical protein